MAEKSREAVESFAYFSTQMTIHIVRTLATLGLDETRLKSTIRQTLAQGIEQFSPEHKSHLEEIARAFFEAVDGGLEERRKELEAKR